MKYPSPKRTQDVRRLQVEVPVLHSISLFFLLSISALLTIITSSSTCTSDCSFPSTRAKADTSFQEENVIHVSLVRRNLMSRPGSSPPRCNSKCGKCTTCRPVHVPVPPGTPVTAEYYPEAWRCKCGNRLYNLYMP